MIYRLPNELPPNGEYLHDSITQEPTAISPCNGVMGRTASAWLRHVFHTAGGRGRNLTPAAWVAALNSAVALAVPAWLRPVALPDFRHAANVAECVCVAFNPDSALLELARKLAKEKSVSQWFEGGREYVKVIGTNPATDAVQRG